MNLKATAGLLGWLFLLTQGRPTLAAALAEGDDDDSNPYSVISERNVFHLNPPPPPVTVDDKPKAELPSIKLSGFLRIGQKTHALFSSTPKDKKDGPIYYNLADGEKEGILEVVRIHEDKGEVEIINTGTPVTLSLKTDTLEPKAPPPNKGALADSGAPRRPKSPDGANPLPGRPAYRFPVPGQAGAGEAAGGPPAIPMPMRRSRVAQ
jgi:hypothetical protein